MSWLPRRLRRTSPREILARGAEALRTATEAAQVASRGAAWRRDRLRLTPVSTELERAQRALARRDWRGADAALHAHMLTRPPRFVLDPADRPRVVAAVRTRFPEAATDAVRRAAPLLAGRHDLLGYHDLAFDSGRGTIDWHFDPVHGRRAPLKFWARVPYLDPACGDHKVIWEINRHQHWLAFGRAAWLTGDRRYADRVIAELESWLEANPPLIGINWSSMLELAFRCLSWMWTLHLFGHVEVRGRPTWVLDVLTGLDRQLDHVSRHLSTFFSPNTHLLGEGLSLYVAGRVLPELEAAPRWERIGRGILLDAAQAQVNADGGHAELSTHYHRYALDFYLLALLVARRTGDDAAGPLADVVMRLATFCRALADASGRLPAIGDDDGGMLFPMCGRDPADVRDSLSLAAAILERPEIGVGPPPEEVFWLLGGEPPDVPAAAGREPASVLFPHTGYAVLRSERVHAVLDVGPHGFLNGGHAHADALSLVLSVDGRRLLIDPGTATYTMDAERRDRFRSTAMHNTVVLDGRAQSEPAGPFHWASCADAHVTAWHPGAPPHHAAVPPAPLVASQGAALDFVEAEHDGYLPAIHRRAVLTLRDGPWIVVDHILGHGDHRVDLYWHVDPAWTWDDERAQFTHEDGLQARLVSTVPDLQHFRGDPEGLGWCAPVYGLVLPSSTLRMSVAGPAPLSVVTAIGTSTSIDLSLEPASLVVEGTDGWHRAAVLVRCGDAAWLVAFATPWAGLALDHGHRELPKARPAAAPRRPTHRAAYRVICAEGALETDARVAAMRLTHTGNACSLSVFEGHTAAWTGRTVMRIPQNEAPSDLHVQLAPAAPAVHKRS